MAKRDEQKKENSVPTSAAKVEGAAKPEGVPDAAVVDSAGAGQEPAASSAPVANAAPIVPSPEPAAAPSAEPVEKEPTLEEQKAEAQAAFTEWQRRNLPTQLVAHIDENLEGNGLAQHAIEQKDARTLMRLCAESLVGVREVGENNRGPLVDLIEEAVNEPLGLPWCMAFVQVCIAYAELKTGVKSAIHCSPGVLDVWNKTPRNLRANTTPLPGAIVMWQKKGTLNGHCGIVTSCGDLELTAVEGNTEAGMSKDGAVERDGGGVYATKRSRNGVGSMQVLGFLKPF